MRDYCVTVIKSVFSGVLIVVGCSIVLSVDNRYVGAALFAVALSGIVSLGLPLYTGAIGYVRTPKAVFRVLLILIGNIIGCSIAGYLAGIVRVELIELAGSLSANRVRDWLDGLISGMFCGVLMYTAVHTYKTKNNYIGVLMCVPAFILAGFDHSVAYVGYVAIGRIFSAEIFQSFIYFVFGNAAGAILLDLTVASKYSVDNNG